MDKLYKELVEIPGVPGFESDVRRYLKAEYIKYADEVIQDNLGGIFGIKRSKKENAPVVMVCGHMDEVGAMITEITKEGLMKMTSMGGIVPEIMLGQHMEVILKDGKRIPGLISTVPPHLLRGPGGAGAQSGLQFESLLLDIGADNAEHAKELGIRVGQQVVFKNYYYETVDGKKVVSKAWDDRWGTGMALELMKSVKDLDLDVTLICGSTVQEEVGLRGARVATQMIQPDVFITCDCSPANDFGLATGKVWGELGKGPLLRFFDPGCIMHRGLREFFIEVAEEYNVKYQYYRSMGGTDAAAAQSVGEGILATTIAICSRYIHTNAGMIHKDDHAEAKKLLTSVVMNLNSKSIKKIKENA